MTVEDPDQDERESLAAEGQKIVIYSIILNFVLRAVGQVPAISELVLLALWLAVASYALLGIVKICSGLGKGQGWKIFFMVLSFVPLANVIALVYLSVKATRMLRAGGWTVGLLGARR